MIGPTDLFHPSPHHISQLSRCFWSTARSAQLSAPYKLCSKYSTLHASSSVPSPLSEGKNSLSKSLWKKFILSAGRLFFTSAVTLLSHLDRCQTHPLFNYKHFFLQNTNITNRIMKDTLHQNYVSCFHNPRRSLRPACFKNYKFSGSWNELKTGTGMESSL